MPNLRSKSAFNEKMVFCFLATHTIYTSPIQLARSFVSKQPLPEFFRNYHMCLTCYNL
ncbi:hypothetical protein Hanom_Chr12g01080651 [Helianthus anomalus]